MSSSGRQAASEPRVHTASFAVSERIEWEGHVHEDAHEILWGCRGTLTVETDEGYFAVPSSLGLWIPAGVRHRVTAASGTRFQCTYLDPSLGAPGAQTSAIAVTDLVESLLTRLAAPPGLAAGPRAHAEALVAALLEPVEIATIDIPMPGDDRTRRVADGILADPADSRSIDDWGHHVGASARNLSRLFTAETGLSFTAWRTRARMRRGIELLAAGYAVSVVSRRVGYATPSAFVHAFRREIGRTPGEFAEARTVRREDASA